MELFLTCIDEMSIQWRLGVVMAEKKIRGKTLSERTGLSEKYISVLKNFDPERLSIDTLNRLCKGLECQPGDLLIYSD